MTSEEPISIMIAQVIIYSDSTFFAIDCFFGTDSIFTILLLSYFFLCKIKALKKSQMHTRGAIS